jgi:predicted polyphosphate/ATP-dependent NAD kinase
LTAEQAANNPKRFLAMKKRIGLLVNPVAGMGGSVGLKGTDGEMYQKALQLGAEPVTPGRVMEFLSHIRSRDDIELFVAPGKMGEEYVKDIDMFFIVVGSTGEDTSGEDTKRIASDMLARGMDLLIIVGGDGTARDVYDAVGLKIPVVAVPAGVKVFSAIFAFSTRAAAEMVDAFVGGADVTEEDVLDIDEDAFREGRLDSRLYGYLTVPNVKSLLQGGKEASAAGRSATESKKEIAAYLVESMDVEALYLLGPGTTLKAIADEIGIQKTLLGVDAVFNKKLVGSDLNEQGILELFNQYKKRKIIVTPIGGNGFIFGRGSKQFTPEVIWQVGRENIIVVGTSGKLNKLDCLRVDTGDFELDKQLSGYMDVTVSYKYSKVMPVKC